MPKNSIRAQRESIYLSFQYIFFSHETSTIQKKNYQPTARNRFNLRTSSTSAPSGEEKVDENADSTSALPSSTTQRAVRPRVPFNLRGRSRPTTAAPVADESPADESNQSGATASDTSSNEAEKSSTPLPASLKPASRFNLRRPNQLLSNRGRVSPLLKTSATTESIKTDSNAAADSEKEGTAVTAAIVDNKESSADENEQANAETSTQPQTGLNRLRNRPRIQIKARDPKADAKSSTPPPYNVNRKANPLIARRKLGSTTTTTG